MSYLTQISQERQSVGGYTSQKKYEALTCRNSVNRRRVRYSIQRLWYSRTSLRSLGSQEGDYDPVDHWGSQGDVYDLQRMYTCDCPTLVNPVIGVGLDGVDIRVLCTQVKWMSFCRGYGLNWTWSINTNAIEFQFTIVLSYKVFLLQNRRLGLCMIRIFFHFYVGTTMC